MTSLQVNKTYNCCLLLACLILKSMTCCTDIQFHHYNQGLNPNNTNIRIQIIRSNNWSREVIIGRTDLTFTA